MEDGCIRCVHDSELDAIAHAIKLLDEPLLKHDEWAMDIAIEQLKNNRFYQLGKESVAIAEVEPSPDICTYMMTITKLIEEAIWLRKIYILGVMKKPM